MPTRSDLGASLDLEVNFIPENSVGRRNRKMVPTLITIHNTGNTDKGANANAHSKLVNRPQAYFYISKKTGRKVYLTWHFTVDDGKVIKHLRLDEQGLHASSSLGNSSSIGIEICMNSDIDQQAAFARAAKLVAVLRYDLGIKASNIRAHYNWSKKPCPALLLDNNKLGKKWDNFLELCEHEYNSIY